MSAMPRLPALLPLVLLPASLTAQAPDRGVPRFPVPASPLALEGPARAGHYVADLGRRAAVFGDETGRLEVWTWPLKLVRDLHLAFRIPDYDEPLDAARVARRVVVRPESFTIVYSHATFTVRQHVLVPLHEPGALILLDVETVRPLDVHVRMHADFDLAWPGAFGGEYITWWADRKAFLLSRGGLRDHNGLVGSPFAVAGTSHPAHDAPTVPSQLTLRFDPDRAVDELIPVVIAGAAAPRDSVLAAYDRILAGAEGYWHEKARHYDAVRADQLSITTPDPALDLAFEWAKVNLDQQLVCNPDLGCGLVAGFGPSGPGNHRPGFGWYFGGDASINSFAMDGIGQFDLVRRGLAFLASYQRDDGKIPHEISHAAARLPWFEAYPYTWFHGDTTPFWLLACYRYWLAAGDDAFLHATWPAILAAYRWSAATDTDGDGLMENPAAGAGAIELGGLGEALHTDIYLAGVWTAALAGVEAMAAHLGHDALAAEAAQIGDRARRTLEEEYWLEDQGIYAFALLSGEGAGAEGSRRARRGGLRLNDALTVWPATALSFGLLAPDRAGRMLARLSAPDVTVDWGARLLSSEHSLYEPLHYNNGAVWPFMTGFLALAHYRYHRDWAGYDLLRDIGRTTFDFARGRHPELVSGAFYRTLDTTVPQQFFATSMFVAPLVQGLLGLDADAPAGVVSVEPHLPAHWDSVAATGFRVGTSRVDLRVRRGPGELIVRVRRRGGEPLRARIAPALPLGARVRVVSLDGVPVPLRLEETAHDVHVVVETELREEVVVAVEYDGGVALAPLDETVPVGSSPGGLRLLDLRRDGEDYVVAVTGRAGTHTVSIRADGIRDLRGAELAPAGNGLLGLRFTLRGSGFVPREIRFRSP